MNKIGFLGLILLAAACGTTSAAEVVLAERGKATEYAVVVPENPGEAVQYAAEELRDWTEKLTGVRLAIVTNATPAKAVYLGGTEPGLGTDGFRVSIEGDNVFVRGSADRGVL